MAYGKSKDLVKRTQSHKVSKDKDGYQRGLVSMVYRFFHKKCKESVIFANKPNYQLAKELHKPIVRKV